MDLLDRMLGHDEWTTAKLIALSEGLTDAQLDQDFDIGHRALRATFDHMVLNVEFWTGVMIGKPIPYESTYSALPSLLERHERSYAIFADLARRMRDEQRFDEVYQDHYDYPQTIGGTILHVILHNSQHRSDVLHILQRLGVPDLPEADPQEWEHATQGFFDSDEITEQTPPPR
jgi:uncharacterized damage-inducible protein DinB